MFLNEEVRSLRWKTPSTIRMMEALENLHLIELWALCLYKFKLTKVSSREIML